MTITLSPVLTASGHFVLAVVRDATNERWQDGFTGLVRSVLAEQVQHAEELLDRVVGSLFHVGLSPDGAAGQPAELARETRVVSRNHADQMARLVGQRFRLHRAET